MLGQDDMDPNQMTSDEIAEDPRSYSAKNVWQRMAIISAGVIMNVITGSLFFGLAYWNGVNETVPMVGAVTPGMPAFAAGLQPGDQIEFMDGEPVHSFQNVMENIIISEGEIDFSGKRADGTPFDISVTPSQGSLRPMVGLGPASTSTLGRPIDPDYRIATHGLPAENASEEFKAGDNIVALNDEPVRFQHEISRLSAQFAAEPMVYTVERHPLDENETPDLDQPATTVAITVPRQEFRDPGLWMAIGPVTYVASGSIADQAGIGVGDELVKINDLEISKDIDPLRLPSWFAQHSGESITLTVRQKSLEGGTKDSEIAVIPGDEPGWGTKPGNLDSPLMVDSLGLGYHVQPRIVSVVAGSEASESDPALFDRAKITKVTLTRKEDVPDAKYDLFLDNPAEFDLAELKEKLEGSGEINWAHIFWSIQSVPNRDLTIEFETESEGLKSVTLTKREFAEGWYLPVRGLRPFEPHRFLVKAESPSDALLNFGPRNSWSKGYGILRTLKSLFTGRLSIKALSGPIGIAKAGAQVADDGFSKLLLFLGFLSINLAILNFLPIPVLDGGHMVFLLYEAVARRKPSPRIVNAATMVGLAFILSMFVFVMYLDIFVNRS